MQGDSEHAPKKEPQLPNTENLPSKLRSVCSCKIAVVRSAVVRLPAVRAIHITALFSWARWKAEFQPEPEFSVARADPQNRMAQPFPASQDMPDRRDGL